MKRNAEKNTLRQNKQKKKNRFQYEIIINTDIRTGKHIQTSIDV